MADKLVSVNDSFDFPAKVTQRQAARLGDTTKPEGQAVSAAVGSAVQTQVTTPGSPLRLTLDTSYGRAATYNFTDTVTVDKVRPDFIRTGIDLFSAADTKQSSMLWLNVLESPKTMSLPGAFMWMTSTDHDNGMGGISIGYSARPDIAPSTWKVITIQGLPDGLKSIETATPWVDPTSGRILVYFQAQDENTGLSQDTHVLTTTNGTAFTYLQKLPDVPTLWPGDGHGGYLGPLMPYGDGYGAYTLSGGTDLARTRFMATRDGLNWSAIGPPESTLVPAFAYAEPVGMPKIHMRPFVWRGQVWAVNRIATLNSAGAEATYSQPVVFRLSDDYRNIASSFYPTLNNPLPDEGAADSVVACVVYFQGQLYAYYRHGGMAGTYRLAVSEA